MGLHETKENSNPAYIYELGGLASDGTYYVKINFKFK
jgi:hypothetical protein